MYTLYSNLAAIITQQKERIHELELQIIDRLKAQKTSEEKSLTVHTAPLVGSNDSLEVENLKKPPPKVPKPNKLLFWGFSQSSIGPDTLLKFIESAQSSILIIDVRTRKEFEAAHIKSSNVICIEPRLIKPNISDDDISQSLHKHEKELFMKRSDYELIILYDEDSEAITDENEYEQDDVNKIPQIKSVSVERLETITLMYKALVVKSNNINSKKLKRRPCLLDGGIKFWTKTFGPRFIIKPQHDININININETTPLSLQSYKKLGSSAGDGPQIQASPGTTFISTQTAAVTMEEYDNDKSPNLKSNTNTSSSTLLSSGKSSASSYLYSPASYNTKNMQVDSSTTLLNSHLNDPLLDFSAKTGINNLGPTSFTKIVSASLLDIMEQKYLPSASELNNNDKTPLSDKKPLNNGDTNTAVNVKIPLSQKNNNHDPVPQSKSQLQAAPATTTVTTTSIITTSSKPSLPPKQYREEFYTGLRNLGNSCYMNCILQCIVGTPELSNIFVSGKFERSINSNNKLGYKGVFARIFSTLVKNLYIGEKEYIEPTSFKFLCGDLRSDFKGSDQQDCLEFLAFLLDGLHEELNEFGGHSALPLTAEQEIARESMSVRQASTIEWERYLRTNYSIITDIFQGQYQSQLKCLVCGSTSTNYNAYSFLSLPVPETGSDVVTLEECFERFTRPEVLNGDNMWNCYKCRKRQPSIKKMMISRLPQILIIHLKRFKSNSIDINNPGTSFEKLNTFVSYPQDSILDLTRFWPSIQPQDLEILKQLPSRGQEPPFRYKLYGVVNHVGSLVDGHYTSYVRRGSLGWCHFDDSVVHTGEWKGVLNRDAYVLFFRRVTK